MREAQAQARLVELMQVLVLPQQEACLRIHPARGVSAETVARRSQRLGEEIALVAGPGRSSLSYILRLQPFSNSFYSVASALKAASKTTTARAWSSMT